MRKLTPEEREAQAEFNRILREERKRQDQQARTAQALQKLNRVSVAVRAVLHNPAFGYYDR